MLLLGKPVVKTHFPPEDQGRSLADMQTYRHADVQVDTQTCTSCKLAQEGLLPGPPPGDRSQAQLAAPGVLRWACTPWKRRLKEQMESPRRTGGALTRCVPWQTFAVRLAHRATWRPGARTQSTTGIEASMPTQGHPGYLGPSPRRIEASHARSRSGGEPCAERVRTVATVAPVGIHSICPLSVRYPRTNTLRSPSSRARVEENLARTP